MVPQYDAVVIGSGLGGLTAGAFMARAGASVLVLERNASLGGAATTYHRGPLIIEASLHETTPPDMAGDPKSELFDLIEDGHNLEMIEVPTFQEVRWHGLGSPFQLPHGFDSIQAALDARFPKERGNVHALLEQVRRIQRIPEFASPNHDLWWRIAHAAELPQDIWAAVRDVRASLSDVFARHFGDNEAIKFALCANLAYYSDDPDNFWWLAFALAQGGYMKAGGYYIRGGSQQLTDSLVAFIRNNGGTILAESPATQIELDTNGAVAAIWYRDAHKGLDAKALCDTLFANAAPHVITDMLPEASQSEFMAPFIGRPLSISLLSATIGLDRPASEFGVTSYSTVLVPDWMKRFADFKHSTPLFSENPNGRMPVSCVVDYGQIDSGLGADGLHPLNIVCPDRLENWEGLDDADYRARRASWLDALISQLDTEWPGLAGAVKASTLSTARTMHQHLNTPGGAIYGFAMIPPDRFPRKPPINAKTSVPGLWLSSAYTGFGGFTGAIGGGIMAAKSAMRDL